MMTSVDNYYVFFCVSPMSYIGQTCISSPALLLHDLWVRFSDVIKMVLATKPTLSTAV